MEFYDNFKFDWDENKQRNNVKKHKVSFYEAITVFSSSPLLTENDDLHSQYEQRYKTTGYSVKNRLLVVIYSKIGKYVYTSPLRRGWVTQPLQVTMCANNYGIYYIQTEEM